MGGLVGGGLGLGFLGHTCALIICSPVPVASAINKAPVSRTQPFLELDLRDYVLQNHDDPTGRIASYEKVVASSKGS